LLPLDRWLDPALPDNRCDGIPVSGAVVRAVTGIGNPARFLATLRAQDFIVEPVVFPDHHAFSDEDFVFNDTLPIVVTAKDAVKCGHLDRAIRRRLYVADIAADLPEAFLQQLEERVAALHHQLTESMLTGA
jgi:tetraacyldisaccharide 4'-kinase